MKSEQEFVNDAIAFFGEIGVDVQDVGAETDLIGSGLLDSLAILTFLDFMEQQWGAEVDVDDLDTHSISTLGRAYRFMESDR